MPRRFAAVRIATLVTVNTAYALVVSHSCRVAAARK
jgi:hypothetical protein